jgi:Tfp pilus assembly protein PilN
MSATPSQLSFLPDDYLERKAQRRTNVVCALLFLIVAVAIVFGFMFADRTLKEARTKNEALSKEYADAARPIAQFQQLQEKQRTMAHQAELTASLLEKIPRSYLLAEITNAIPAGASLLDFDMQSRKRVAPPKVLTAFEQRRLAMSGGAAPAAAPPAAPRVYDVDMKISGIAPTDVQVAQFISRLSRSPLFKDVNLVISDEFVVEDTKVRKFQIELALNNDASIDPSKLPEPEKSTAAVELGEK